MGRMIRTDYTQKDIEVSLGHDFNTGKWKMRIIDWRFKPKKSYRYDASCGEFIEAETREGRMIKTTTIPHTWLGRLWLFMIVWSMINILMTKQKRL